MKTQSRAFRTSDWAEGSSSNSAMTPSTQQEWLIDNSVNVFEWPSQSLGCLEPNQIILEKPENVCLPPSNLTELERWRMADNCQMLMYKACCIVPKNTWGCKGASAKYWVKGLNTYTMYFSFLYIYKAVTVLFLLCHYGVWSVDWCGEKSNLKQYNMRRQHKKTLENKLRFEYARHCICTDSGVN